MLIRGIHIASTSFDSKISGPAIDTEADLKVAKKIFLDKKKNVK